MPQGTEATRMTGAPLAIDMPPVVSEQEWEAARERLLVKEKAHTKARDALAAERRRMPWMAVEKNYQFDGPDGKLSLLDLFDGRRQLIVYRAFFEPGVHGWPDHACIGCSLGADQVSNLVHLNARNTTLVYASRAPQTDIKRLKARMGWQPLQRQGSPKDIAEAVLFLASDRAAQISGQVLSVDGGSAATDSRSQIAVPASSPPPPTGTAAAGAASLHHADT